MRKGLRWLDLPDFLVAIGGMFLVASAAMVHRALGLAVLGLALAFVGVQIGKSGGAGNETHDDSV